jgi:hypothetical protein
MSTIIGNLNAQRNTNCSVQASQFNGGHLAQSFNLQAMRIVKGYATLASSISGSIGGNGSVLVNAYDDSAIELGPSDIVIAGVMENASGTWSPGYASLPYSGGTGSVGNIPLVSVSGTATIYHGGLPTFNNSTQLWTAGTVGAGIISPAMTASNLNGGVRFNAVAVTTSTTQKYWLNCVTGTAVFTSPNPTVLVTLLVMNPGLAQ